MRFLGDRGVMLGLDSLLHVVPVVVGCFFCKGIVLLLESAWVLLVRLGGTRGGGTGGRCYS